MAHRPVDVPNLVVSNSAKPDDLVDMMRQTTIKRAAVMEISEAEINRHLATTLAGKVGAMYGGLVTFEGARIDLEPGEARLILIWKLRGYTRTASVDLAINRDENNFHVDLLRGAYGHLRVPRGLMRPLYPSLSAVADALDPEIRTLFQMTKITITKDKLLLDPRFPPA